MWRREFFENVKWNSGQSDQEWRSDVVSRGHLRSKTKLLRADKWFVIISVRILANLPRAGACVIGIFLGRCPRLEVAARLSR
jgi:hypothetical protein